MLTRVCAAQPQFVQYSHATGLSMHARTCTLRMVQYVKLVQRMLHKPTDQTQGSSQGFTRPRESIWQC